MITLQKNKFLITSLFLLVPFTIQSMKRQRPGTTSPQKQGSPTKKQKTNSSTPIQQIESILLGQLPFYPGELLPFLPLPQEDLDTIASFLLLNTNATSITTAAQAINSLAQVNNELNNLINNPLFCLRLIKYLSIRFNCSNESAAEQLHTSSAKQRIIIQEKFYKLCSSETFLPNAFNILISQGADPEFTYNSLEQDETPLMVSLEDLLYTQALLKAGTDIDQAERHGETALLFAIERELTEAIQTLLDAGANPNIANNNGRTPLIAAQATENQEIINLVQEAIRKQNQYR